MPLLVSSRAAGATMLVLSTLLVAALSGADRADDLLTDEDVVRMHVSGSSTEKIMETIRTSAVEFDLSDEMVEELRYAGLPDRLIEAMRARQLELHPPASAPAARPAAAPLVIELSRKSPGKEPRRANTDVANRSTMLPLRLFNLPPPELLQQLGLDPTLVTDLALWVGCTTPTHVPDHWRGETPLGRDFTRTPRHRLLAFVPGATLDVDGARKVAFLRALSSSVDPAEFGELELGLLELPIPETIEIELDPAEQHSLVVGVAIGLADRFLVVTLDTVEGFVPADHEGRLAVQLRDGAPYMPAQIKVEIELPDAP